ncbi:MAG: ATP-binding domain-containing protein, partial [Chloroflexota bacterium]
WTSPTRDGGPVVDGEADALIAHPDLGILVLEVKSGEPSRDGAHRWYIGPNELPRSPFEQAKANKHALLRRFRALPGWPRDSEPHAGHGVAFPEVDLASLPRRHALLGPDVDGHLILDAEALESAEATRAWVEATCAYWLGDGTKGIPLGPAGMRLLDGLLAPHWTLHRLVRGRIEDDRDELLAATHAQKLNLDRSRQTRRLEVVGPAGSGKSMLAAERARRLAAEGYRTLLVCFNQPLATALGRDLADAPAPGGLVVSTFHRLCETVAARAGTLPPRPDPVSRDWFDEILPAALGRAIDSLPGERFHALIVDEGQDFELDWLLLVQALLRDPDEDVLWVFHDPGQAIRCSDVVGQLGLERMELYENLRNPGSIAALANRFYRGDQPIEEVMREPDAAEDDAPATARYRVIEAERGRPTVEAVRKEFHRLIVDEEVRTWQIVVLSGTSAVKSDIWATRTFGNVMLWNEALNDDGTSRGLAPEEVPDDPSDAVLFETIRRFKGLERPVVILAELPTEGDRLDELIYVALTRPTTELVVVAPRELAGRFA